MGVKMRAVFLTEELMAVVLKFSRNSADIGNLWVSLDVPGSEKLRARKNLTHVVQIVFSLCFGILLLSMLFFLVCSLDSATVSDQPWPSLPSLVPPSRTWISQPSVPSSPEESVKESKREETAALQGLGTLFRRGTKSMSELIVVHLSEHLAIDDFRFFLRTLHRSGASAKADIVLLFPWSPLPPQFRQVIDEEESYFQELLVYLRTHISLVIKETHESKGRTISDSWDAIHQPLQAEDRRMKVNALEHAFTRQRHKISAPTSSNFVPLSSNASLSKLNYLAFGLSSEKTSNLTNSHSGRAEGRSLRQEWGSISGYEMAELDPTDTLAAFLEFPSADLRRWFCYQILLGMPRNKYKHVLLIKAGKVLILKDALAVVRKSSLLYLTAEDRTWIEEAESLKHLDVLKLNNTEHDIIHIDPTVLRDSETTSKHKRFVGSQANLLVSELAERVDDLESESKVLEAGKAEFSNGKNRKKAKQRIISKERAGMSKGLIESVYGREMWLQLEAEEKRNNMLVSSVLMGAMRPVRRLSNAMAIEIVRIALQRKKRSKFSDQALLNYLIHKSSVLGRKVTDHLMIVTNKNSVIHALAGSRQSDIPIRDNGDTFAVIENYGSNPLKQFGGQNFVTAVKQDICSSPLESIVYRDCKQ